MFKKVFVTLIIMFVGMFSTIGITHAAGSLKVNKDDCATGLGEAFNDGFLDFSINRAIFCKDDKDGSVFVNLATGLVQFISLIMIIILLMKIISGGKSDGGGGGFGGGGFGGGGFGGGGQGGGGGFSAAIGDVFKDRKSSIYTLIAIIFMIFLSGLDMFMYIIKIIAKAFSEDVGDSIETSRQINLD